MGSWSEFLTAFWAGPGWFPGTGRLGDITFVAEHPKREKYDTSVPVFLHLYTILHFALQFLTTNFIGFASKTKVRLPSTDYTDSSIIPCSCCPTARWCCWSSTTSGVSPTLDCSTTTQLSPGPARLPGVCWLSFSSVNWASPTQPAPRPSSSSSSHPPSCLSSCPATVWPGWLSSQSNRSKLKYGSELWVLSFDVRNVRNKHNVLCRPSLSCSG